MDYNFDVADKTLFVTRGANMLHVASIRVSSPLAKAINSLRQRIATLEAEKAERDAQEPVAWICRDSLNEPWKLGSGPQTMRWETLALYAEPPIPHVDPDWLANVIRTVDGNHSLGAGALAEKIAEAINARGGK